MNTILPLALLGAIALGPFPPARAGTTSAGSVELSSSNRLDRLPETGAPPPNPPATDDLLESPRNALRRCIYRAPRFGPPRVRSVSVARSQNAALPNVQVLAPDHPGLTVQAQPRLYYYLSEPVTRLDITLASFRQTQPLLELHLTDSLQPGIHELDLAKHGVELPLDTESEWYVAVVRDPARRSRDLVSRAVIKRIRPDSALQHEIREPDPRHRPVALAEAGIWYDALEALVELRRANSDDSDALEGLQSLLRQVDLVNIPIRTLH